MTRPACLAESACRLWETKPLPLLRKTVHNPAQSGLKEAAARRANVLGVYEAVDPERISGHRILLVDDICTTGATLAECARVLREAGAADVVCAAAALTPLERDSGKKGLNRWKLFTKLVLHSQETASIIKTV